MALAVLVKKDESPLSPPLLSVLNRVQASAPSLSPRGLATALSACARLGPNAGRPSDRRPSLIESLCRGVERGAAALTAREVANVLNALARMGRRDEALLAALGTAARERCGEFNSQEAANAFNAFAKFGVADSMLLGALCRASRRVVDDLKPQELASVFNALAKFEFEDKALLGALRRASLGRIDRFNAQDVANTFNALAKFPADYGTPELTERLGKAAMALLPDFTPQALANIAHAVVVLSLHCQPLSSPSSPSAPSSLSLSSSGVGAELLRALFETLSRIDEKKFADKDLSQLYLAQLATDIERRDLALKLPAKMVSLASTFHLQRARSMRSSAFHKEVSSTLQKLGIPHSNEDIVFGLSVDITLVSPSPPSASGRGADAEPRGRHRDKMVIEVDGPQHYLKDVDGYTRTFCGVHALKTRLLMKKGVKVLHVPHFDWAPIATNEEKKMRYLERLLSDTKRERGKD